MRIVCPNCAAEYEVPASRLAPQRKLRCSRCGGAWLAADPPAPDAFDQDPLEFRAGPEDERETAPLTALPPVTAMDRLTAAARHAKAPASLTAAWIMTFIILIAAVGAMIAWREPLVRAWPAGGRILGRAEPVAVSPPPHAPAKAAEAGAARE